MNNKSLTCKNCGYEYKSSIIVIEHLACPKCKQPAVQKDYHGTDSQFDIKSWRKWYNELIHINGQNDDNFYPSK